MSGDAVADELAPSLWGMLGTAFGPSAGTDPNQPEIPKPAFRFLILGKQRDVIGHLAAHEREVGIGGEASVIGMIGQVAIANKHQRQGHCKRLVKLAHEYFQERSIFYSILFACKPEVYHSSGYHLMENEIYFLDEDGVWKTFVFRGSMYCELGDRPWPNQKIDLRGPVV
ncbi:MAG: GNAT family N-acetyltransferase [Rhizobiales bacterium]|nr:GNAT family N-acetyltransferase [Hyphomicrobiales bacterium]